MSGAGVNIMGSGFSFTDDETDYGRQDELYKQQLNDQIMFANNGIQWRVADAQKAGVHPVWALSGGGAAYSSPGISVGSRGGSSFNATMGQDVSRAAASTMTPEQRLLGEIELATAKNRLAMSEIELNNQRRGNSAQVGPGMPSSSIPGDMFAGDWSSTTPAQRVSHDLEDPSTTASAPSPMFEKFTFGGTDGGRETVWLPSGGKGTPTEALESLSESWPMMYGVISENLRRDPELVYKLRHLWPGGEMAADVAKWLESNMQRALNYKKGRAAAHEMARENMRSWNRSGRERGINWR